MYKEGNMHKRPKSISSLVYSPSMTLDALQYMAMNPTGSHSSVGKEYLMTEKMTHNFLHLECTPQSPLPDKVATVKSDLILALPMLIMFCESDVGYIHQLTPLDVSKTHCHILTG